MIKRYDNFSVHAFVIDIFGHETANCIAFVDFVKNTVIPLLIVLIVLTAFALSICYYHCSRYMYELEGYAELQTDDNGYFGDDEDDGCNKEEALHLQRKSRLQGELSINASAASVKLAEYKSLNDIISFLHLRDVTLNALYNYDEGFFQISVTRIRLFPLPNAVSDKFKLQYKLFFLIPDSISCESSPKPLRHQIHFDEKYRMHHSWDDVKDAEMRLNVCVLDVYFNIKVLPTVRYVLKPVTTLDNESYGEAISNDITIQCIRQVSPFNC